MGTSFIEVDPVSDLGSFVLVVECQEKERFDDEALEELKRYIVDSLEDRGLDISIIPDNLDDFMDWVRSISDSFDGYIISYIDSAIGDNPSDAILSGWWDIHEGKIDEEMKGVINRIIEKSKTLEDLVSGLRDTPEFADARIIYDYYYDDAEYFAKRVVEDVIKSLKGKRMV